MAIKIYISTDRVYKGLCWAFCLFIDHALPSCFLEPDSSPDCIILI